MNKKKIAVKISRHEKFLVSLEIMDHPSLRLLSDRSIDIILLKGCVVHWAIRCNGSAEARKYKLHRHYPPYSEIVGICDIYFRINVPRAVVICLYCCTHQNLRIHILLNGMIDRIRMNFEIKFIRLDSLFSLENNEW